MSWTDKASLRTIRSLAEYYDVSDFVETGTFKGVNAEVHARNFERVLTVESNPVYFEQARERLKKYPNVFQHLGDSNEFLKSYTMLYNLNGRGDNPIFYLDAHFYNPKGPRWVIQDELRALEGFKNGVIIIHDFNNGLGHCQYDGERLGMNVVGNLLNKVNPQFHYYTNNASGCDIMRPNETNDPVIVDNLNYAWSKEDRGKRGILYCTPTTLPRGFNLDTYIRQEDF